MYRMHIHVPTDKRYEPIDYIMGLGTVTKVAMENLLAQMDQRKAEVCAKLHFAPSRTRSDCGVAVSPGHGISRIFASSGCGSHR